MIDNVISKTFPTVCRLLANSPLDDDIQRALELAKSPQAVDELKLAFNEKMFRLNDLTLALACGTILPYTHPVGAELERNLATVISAVGFDRVRSAYRKKLLINSKDNVEDVRYEIAVAARACALLDPGSVDLEVGIHGTDNDSDVRGTYQGIPVRLEVTVLHDSLPPAVAQRFEAIVLAASLSSGFIVNVRQVISSQNHANHIRALIEQLHKRHAATSGADWTIDGIQFNWCRGSYKCDQRDSPIVSVEFDLQKDVRLIERPVSSRSMTPQYMLDDFEQPEGVVTMVNLPHDSATHRRTPLSGTILKKIAGKLKQCEDEVVNVVVLGKPLQMGDDDVNDALYGVLVVAVPFTENSNGGRQFDMATTTRDPKAPFVPVHLSADPIQFVDPFRKVSAVWLLRLGESDALSRCLPNPNAANAIPRGLNEAIANESANRPSYA